MEKIIAWFVIGAILALSCVTFFNTAPHAMPDAAANRLARLIKEAPETLQPPERSAFASAKCWSYAMDRFETRGDWATDVGDHIESCM